MTDSDLPVILEEIDENVEPDYDLLLFDKDLFSSVEER